MGYTATSATEPGATATAEPLGYVRRRSGAGAEPSPRRLQLLRHTCSRAVNAVERPVLLALSELKLRVNTPSRVPRALVRDRLDTRVSFMECLRSYSFAKSGIVRSSSPVVMLARVLVPAVL